MMAGNREASMSGTMHHQISFILGGTGDGELFQRDFLATADEVDALKESLDDAMGEHVQDLRMYPPTNSFENCSAIGTVSDLLGAAGVGRWAKAPAGAVEAWEAAGNEVDAAGECEGAEPWNVEFVWSNGGGDDNAYSQGFMGPPGAVELQERYLNGLEACIGQCIRDARITRGNPEPEGDISMALEAVLEFLEDNGFGNAAVDLRHAWAGRNCPTRSAM